MSFRKILLNNTCIAISLFILTLTLTSCAGPSATIGSSAYSIETEFKNRGDAIKAIKDFFVHYQNQESNVMFSYRLKDYSVTNEYFEYTLTKFKIGDSSIRTYVNGRCTNCSRFEKSRGKLYYDEIREIIIDGNIFFPNTSDMYFKLNNGFTIGKYNGLCISGYLDLAEKFGSAIVYLREFPDNKRE